MTAVTPHTSFCYKVEVVSTAGSTRSVTVGSITSGPKTTPTIVVESIRRPGYNNLITVLPKRLGDIQLLGHRFMQSGDQTVDTRDGVVILYLHHALVRKIHA